MTLRELLVERICSFCWYDDSVKARAAELCASLPNEGSEQAGAAARDAAAWELRPKLAKSTDDELLARWEAILVNATLAGATLAPLW